MENRQKNVECPLEFYGQPANEQGRKNLNRIPEKEGTPHTPNSVVMNYGQSTSQTDSFGNFRAKLDYDIRKSHIDLEKKQLELGQRLEYERQLTELKMRYGAFMELMHCTIYRDTTGVLMFAITTPDEKTMMAKRLLNVENFESKHFMSYNPGGESVLEVTWGGKNEGFVRFRFSPQEGILPDFFLKRLKARGVLFLLSGKSEKKAAAALLAYALENAMPVELPFKLGWGKTKEGKWHFAWRGELTLREVLENAEK